MHGIPSAEVSFEASVHTSLCSSLLFCCFLPPPDASPGRSVGCRRDRTMAREHFLELRGVLDLEWSPLELHIRCQAVILDIEAMSFFVHTRLESQVHRLPCGGRSESVRYAKTIFTHTQSVRQQLRRSQFFETILRSCSSIAGCRKSCQSDQSAFIRNTQPSHTVRCKPEHLLQFAIPMFCIPGLWAAENSVRQSDHINSICNTKALHTPFIISVQLSHKYIQPICQSCVRFRFLGCKTSKLIDRCTKERFVPNHRRQSDHIMISGISQTGHLQHRWSHQLHATVQHRLNLAYRMTMRCSCACCQTTNFFCDTWLSLILADWWILASNFYNIEYDTIVRFNGCFYNHACQRLLLSERERNNHASQRQPLSYRKRHNRAIHRILVSD